MLGALALALALASLVHAPPGAAVHSPPEEVQCGLVYELPSKCRGTIVPGIRWMPAVRLHGAWCTIYVSSCMLKLHTAWYVVCCMVYGVCAGYFQPSTGQLDCISCDNVGVSAYQESPAQTACLLCAANTQRYMLSAANRSSCQCNEGAKHFAPSSTVLASGLGIWGLLPPLCFVQATTVEMAGPARWVTCLR